MVMHITHTVIHRTRWLHWKLLWIIIFLKYPPAQFTSTITFIKIKDPTHYSLQPQDKLALIQEESQSENTRHGVLLPLLDSAQLVKPVQVAAVVAVQQPLYMILSPIISLLENMLWNPKDPWITFLDHVPNISNIIDNNSRKNNIIHHVIFVVPVCLQLPI